MVCCRGLMVMLVACVGLLAPAAHAVTPAVLVDETLTAQRVRVTGLREGRLSYFDADRRLRTEAIGQFVQLRGIGETAGDVSPTGALPTPKGAGLILIDGQRLAGEWVGAVADGGAIVWAHPLLGKVSISLDRLRGWHGETEGDEAPARAWLNESPTTDRLVLSNGDALEGFVTAVTETGVEIQQDDGAAPIALPRDRIAAVVLANPVPTAGTEGQRLVMRDGSVIDGRSVAIRSETVRFEPTLGEAGVVEVPLSAVRRIDFTGGGRRLAALGDLARQVSGGEVFGVAMRPRVEADGALWLHAPVAVTFELPEGARRLAAEAALAGGADAPSELHAWADFELTVTVDGESQRYRLHGDQPRVRLNAALSGSSLRLELTAGANGPVLDRLRLRDAVVLIEGVE